MDAGEGFAPPMIRAYETELLATLPAITMVPPVRFEQTAYSLQVNCSTK